jgi:hypothetical protein
MARQRCFFGNWCGNPGRSRSPAGIRIAAAVNNTDTSRRIAHEHRRDIVDGVVRSVAGRPDFLPQDALARLAGVYGLDDAVYMDQGPQGYNTNVVGVFINLKL